MLMPKRVKHRKQFRGNMSGTIVPRHHGDIR
jgi:ribosomal protein L16/L10AE